MLTSDGSEWTVPGFIQLQFDASIKERRVKDGQEIGIMSWAVVLLSSRRLRALPKPERLTRWNRQPEEGGALL
jgi:hypothetical protein